MRKNGLVSNFQTPKNFDSGYCHDSNRNSISTWHYNQQDRFVMQVSGCKEKIPMFQRFPKTG